MIPNSNEVRFEVTTRCNYNCLICPREKLTRKHETMSFGLFKSLLDKIVAETKQYNVLTFAGFGEPMLDPSLLEKISYAKGKGLEVLMLTNASMLTLKRFKELEAAGLSSIRVSFYGDTSSVYNKIHNPFKDTIFDKIKSELTQICQEKDSMKVLFTYNVVDDLNADDAETWIEYWINRADLIEVWRPHNWVDGRRYRSLQSNTKKTCGRPFATPLQVQVDGTVNMCCFDFDGKLTIGDLKKQSLEEIFTSDFFNKIYKHHKDGDFKGSGLICEECDQRNADKSDVMIFNSRYDISDRVNQVSTTYKNI